MRLLSRETIRRLRAPVDRYLSFSKLKAFHRTEHTLDEIVDQAMNFGGHGYFRVTTTQVRSEILNLAKSVAALKPKNILEIGTARGGTLFIWSQLASKRVISCDINDLSRQRPLYEQFASPKSNCDCRLVIGNSHDPSFAASVEKMFDGEKVDFLFIDGDHTEVGVRQDYELYKHMVRPGGLIAFHDIVENQPLPENQVFEFWKHLRPTVEFEEFVDNKQQCGFGIGIVRVKSAA